MCIGVCEETGLSQRPRQIQKGVHVTFFTCPWPCCAISVLKKNGSSQ